MARNTRSKGPASKTTLLRRLGLLTVLFLVAGSISYPQGANWIVDRFNQLTTLKVGHVNKPVVLGLDLQGGTRLEYEADLTKIADSERSSAMDGIRDVIDRRVNAMGVSEPLVQTTKNGNQWRLTVELAGVRDIKQAIQMIGETPTLDFRVQNPDANRPPTDAEYKKVADENASRKAKAQAVLDQVKKGDSLETIASKTSEDTDSAQKGGDLGWVLDQSQYAKLVEVFRDQQPGLYPQVIDDGANFYIADLLEKKAAGQEVQASHILVQWKGAEQSSSTSTKEQALAKIKEIQSKVNSGNFDEMAKKYSEEPGADKSAGDLGWFRKGMMVQPFEDAAFKLKSGEVSGIVETPFGYHIIKVTGIRDVFDAHVRAAIYHQQKISDIVNTDPWKRTELTGKQIKRATLDFDQRTGASQVLISFNDEGAKLFDQLTKENVGKQIAIYLDGKPISIPTVQVEIPSGEAVISGNFTVDEAKLLAQRLQAGALPVPINLIAQQSVGPTLGSQSVQDSLKAGLIGFALVFLFMLLYYRLPGLLADFALVFYVALVIAIFKLIPVTLTLSGIAGFILSMGIAVDANVLVFERLKEEYATGKPTGQAIDEAFKRAWTSIRDGNMTTLISCAVLYMFTSSLVKGFALTLGIGVLISMFTAISVARTLLKLVAGTKFASKMPWLMLKPRSNEKETV